MYVLSQLNLLSVGMENVHLLSAELCQNVYVSSCSLSNCISGTRRPWQRGQLEFEALMRQLDIAVSITKSGQRPHHMSIRYDTIR